MSMRIDRLLSNAGYGTRKEVKQLIRRHRVSCDGRPVDNPGRILTESDYSLVEVDGRRIHPVHTLHLAMHKPAGYVTAAEDKWFPTVSELIPAEFSHAGLFPVGRLDKDTTGLLLFTNDGTLAHRLISPKWGIQKTYRWKQKAKNLKESDIDSFAAGIVLDDFKCKSAELVIRGPHRADLTLTEGKYHQVKRMMMATGREVISLKRLSMSTIDLNGLDAQGDMRQLSAAEAQSLYFETNLPQPII